MKDSLLGPQRMSGGSFFIQTAIAGTLLSSVTMSFFSQQLWHLRENTSDCWNTYVDRMLDLSMALVLTLEMWYICNINFSCQNCTMCRYYISFSKNHACWKIGIACNSLDLEESKSCKLKYRLFITLLLGILTQTAFVNLENGFQKFTKEEFG